MRRLFAALVLAVLSLAMLTGPAGALTAADADAERGYICIRSHLLLGEDNPICVHFTAPNESADA